MENSIAKQERLKCNECRGINSWSCYTDCAFWDGKICTLHESESEGVMERLTYRHYPSKEACLAYGLDAIWSEKLKKLRYDIITNAVGRLAAYEDTGLTPEQIEILKDCNDMQVARRDIDEQRIQSLVADKDEQAGRIMRMENILYQARDMLKMGVDYLNHEQPFSPLESMKIAIMAIDALLGGAEDEQI